MTRFATPLILASLLAMGGYQPTAAQEKPATPEALKAEIEVELAYKLLNRQAVWKIANLLRGAMLSDASAGPGKARTYNDGCNAPPGAPHKDILEDGQGNLCVVPRDRGSIPQCSAIMS